MYVCVCLCLCLCVWWNETVSGLRYESKPIWWALNLMAISSFFREPCHLPSRWSTSSHSLPSVYIQRQAQQSIRGNLWLLKIQVPPSSTQTWHLSGAEISFGFCPHLFLSLRVCLLSHSLCLTSSCFSSRFLTTPHHLFSSPFLPLATSAFTFSLSISHLWPLFLPLSIWIVIEQFCELSVSHLNWTDRAVFFSFETPWRPTVPLHTGFISWDIAAHSAVVFV